MEYDAVASFGLSSLPPDGDRWITIANQWSVKDRIHPWNNCCHTGTKLINTQIMKSTNDEADNTKTGNREIIQSACSRSRELRHKHLITWKTDEMGEEVHSLHSTAGAHRSFIGGRGGMSQGRNHNLLPSSLSLFSEEGGGDR